MQILQKTSFHRAYKKLKPNQKKDADKAIRMIMANPLIGVQKKGDLADVFVFKFKMVHQLTLLAYTFENDKLILTLLAIGSHENFYRDLKSSTSSHISHK